MKKYTILIVLFCLAFTFSFGQFDSSDQTLADTATVVPHEYIIKFKKGTSHARQANLRRAGAARLEKQFRSIDAELWTIDHAKDEAKIVSEFSRNPDIEYIEPNYIYRSNAVPNDPLFNQLWGLHNSIDSPGQIDVDIDAKEAWDIYEGSGSKPVAIVDTGIDFAHPDLNGQTWQNLAEDADGDGRVLELDFRGNYVFDPDDINGIDDDGNGYIDDFVGWDFVRNRNLPVDVSNNGHGTHVAGTVGASQNNNKGISGVNPNAKLVYIKYLNDSGNGSTDRLIEIIQYIVDLGIPISNNSFGGSAYSQPLYDMLVYAQSKGHVFVASAGNNGRDNDANLYYPASYELDNVVSVASIDRYDELAATSSYGETTVDIGAPGVNVLSCKRGSSDYYMKSGTSMAAPHVAGALSLAWEYAPNLSYQEIIDVMLHNVEETQALQGKCISNGRLNAYNMLIALSGGCRSRDSLSLVAFNQAAKGQQWSVKWNLNQPLNTWYGVTLNNDGCVTALDLSNNNLSGTLAIETGALHMLTSLKLNNNAISGSLPEHLGDLNYLQELYLNNNSFSGSIPTNMSNLYQVQKMYLHDNQFSGLIPNTFAGLTAVETLHLQNNMFSGPIPVGLANLNNLTNLLLYNNNMSGCFYPDINVLCTQIGSSNSLISNGNNFDQSWSSFCQFNSGECNDMTCRSLDSLALISLYNATSGSSWRYTWNIYSPMDSWYGVSLNENGCVESVDLAQNNLVGTIPPGIGGLTNIKSLNLIVNSLGGEIPAELGQLNLLSSLKLSRNQLVGELPAAIGNLENLELLWLNRNRLEGPIPDVFQLFTKLKIIYMGSNKFTGGVPASFGNMISIEEILLNGNSLDGTIPESVGDALSLKKLDLGQNQLTGTIPTSIGNLAKLVSLNLGSNQLTGSIPSSLGNLTYLGSLFLGSNNLTGQIPSALGNIAGIQDILLQYNQLTGSIPANFGDLSNLHQLFLHSNNLSGCFDSNLKKLCGKLHGPASVSAGNNFDAEFLDFCDFDAGMCGQSITCRTQDSLNLVLFYQSTNGPGWNNQWNLNLPMTAWYGVTLSEAGCVMELNVASNNITGSLPPSFGHLNHVVNLDLSGNNISGLLPSSLSHLHDVVSLDFSDNNISGPLPSSLSQLSNLINLYLSNNNFTGSIPSEYGNIALQKLYLSNNDLSGCYDPNLKNLCSTLVHSNSVSEGNNFNGQWSSFCSTDSGICDGDLPCSTRDSVALIALYDAVGANSSLSWDFNQPIESWDYVQTNSNGCVTRLSLANTGLEGTLPEAIGDMSDLQQLWMTSNNLSGEIPESIGQLTNLQILYLHLNNLSGSIPLTLNNLDLLNVINLSHNQLSGSIPNSFNSLANIEKIYLSDNSFTGPIPDYLTDLQNLKALSLSNNSLSGSIPTGFGSLTQFRELQVDQNALTGQIPTDLGNSSSLRTLKLENNMLSGQLPSNLGNINFFLLNLSQNNLSGCYGDELMSWCGRQYDYQISVGNNFDAVWSDFCSSADGACSEQECPTILELNDVIPNGISRAHAEIYASGTVESSLITTFKAGNLVQLDIGFEVVLGASFEVLIEACE